MQIEFKSGASVSAMWGDLSDGELVAAFARSKTEEDVKHGLCNRYYIVTDHYRGSVTIVRPPSPKEPVS